MSRPRFLSTGITLATHIGSERELSLVVGYEFTSDFKGSHDEPACGATVEITSVALFSADKVSLSVPAWLQSWIEDDQNLHDSLAAEAAEQDVSDRADAEERRAEERAERLREDG